MFFVSKGKRKKKGMERTRENSVRNYFLVMSWTALTEINVQIERMSEQRQD